MVLGMLFTMGHSIITWVAMDVVASPNGLDVVSHWRGCRLLVFFVMCMLVIYLVSLFL